MVKAKTVFGWNFSCLGYEANDNREVAKIYRKVCKKFFSTDFLRKSILTDVKGRVQSQVDKFIKIRKLFSNC